MSIADPSILCSSGVRVRLRDNPGKQGVTTGRCLGQAPRLLVEVMFGPNEVVFKPATTLEQCPAGDELPIELLCRGEFGTVGDLRRLLTFEKIRGHLTNVLYSMESSNTDFYPHQFKPVLKFLESPDGRLLIADEVGLGKTIEAIYIWKELQAREQAQRLLVICPAMLQDKWRSDLRYRFNILADIATSRVLKERLDSFAEIGNRLAFTSICSLESMRPPANWEDEANGSLRAQLARLFERMPATEAGALFDLVIIDEAHYLRNPSTASNRLARLLRETARHLLLLTATPVQLNSENLYQLLRLIDPDFFFDSQSFDVLLNANRPVVAALRYVWNQPPDLVGAKAELEQALQSPFFATNSILNAVAAELDSGESLVEDVRVRLGQQLESASLLSQYLTRTRKRDVIEPRVERVPRVLAVSFSREEKEIYDRITARIRARARGYRGVALFQEIARQRRMASCLVAALRGWGESGDLEGLLWEDLGVAVGLSEDVAEDESVEGGATSAEDEVGSIINYELLERVDNKYRELLGFLRGRLAENPREKFVLFAYFRGTLAYLRARLERDGVRAVVIQGGMGDEKWEVIERFRETEGLSVLLSSDVGSEGIDLQFCRFLINYDLPWNPMKVEQRIGRIDRLGQKAEKIFIVNFALKDTVEDRILQRLYDRIRIFRESVGDLEEILGQVTERLLVEMFTEEMTEEEMQRKADQVAMAIAARRVGQEKLENEAINLLAFSDYILQAVARSRERGRWIQPEEIRRFVEDFFHRRYPGTVIRRHESRGGVYLVTLSALGKTDLQSFLFGYSGVRTTDLHRANDVGCFFDPKQAGVMGRRYELVDQTHPLIQWMKMRYEQERERFHPVTATRVQAGAGVARGRYVYAAHLWRLSGLRRESRICYKVVRVEERAVLSDEESEQLVSYIAQEGQEFPNARNLLEIDEICAQARRCEALLLEAYDRVLADFSAENENRCTVQEKSARQHHERRLRELMERLERFRAGGRTAMIPATEGLVRKLEGELQIKLDRINRSRLIDNALVPLAVGVVDVA